jgi:hypothetical protein
MTFVTPNFPLSLCNNYGYGNIQFHVNWFILHAQKFWEFNTKGWGLKTHMQCLSASTLPPEGGQIRAPWVLKQIIRVKIGRFEECMIREIENVVSVYLLSINITWNDNNLLHGGISKHTAWHCNVNKLQFYGTYGKLL